MVGGKMPKKEIKLNVFVASPSDVNPERELLSSICTELNKVWGDWLGLNLNLVKWETDIYPGVSSYSQNVINEQLDDNYDVFIALFWNRLGTPTEMEASGTVEELNRAFSKLENSNDHVDIMVYFKEQVGGNDTSQQKLVHKLKTNLAERGTLYWEYRKTKDFEPLLRIHLSRIAQQWAKKLSLDKTQQIDKNVSYEMDLLLDEYYYLLAGKSGILSVVHKNILNSLELHIEKFKELGENIKLLSNSNHTGKKHFRLLDIYADINNSITEIIANDNILLVHNRREFFELLSKVISIEIGLKSSPRLEEVASIITPWINLNEESIKEINILISNLELIPNLTNIFSVSKQNMLSEFKKYVNELQEVIELTKFALESIDSVENKRN